MTFRVEELESRRVMAVSVAGPLPDIVLPAEVSSQTISLAGRFDDTAVTGTVVEFNTNSPSPNQRFFVELFDQAGPARSRTTPLSAANFLAYANAGSYTNSIIHRSEPGFVIQGGGFARPTTASDQAGGSPTVIPTSAPISLEAGNSNVRGTIAMARTDDPNSATSQFYFNTGDNSGSLDPTALSAGYTVFGRVLGNGMAAVDAMASVSRYDARGFYSNGNFANLPLRDVPTPIPSPLVIQPAQFVTTTSVRQVGELVYTVQSSNAAVATAAIDGNGAVALSLPPAASGTVTITVRATSVHDAADFAEDSFTLVRAAGDPATAVVGRSGNEVWLARSSGAAFSSTRLATLPGSEWAALVTGDFDGDGRDDVASLAPTGQWWVSLTPGSGAATPATWATWSMTTPWTAVVTGDFTGDGKTDIAGRNSSGAWFVARSTGGSFTTSRFGAWGKDADWTNIMAADFDGDGKTDIAGRFATTGSWWVSRSSGTAFTNAMFGTWTRGVTWADVKTGDFDDDGRADIIGRNSSGAWWVSRSTGSSFTTTRFGGWSTSITWADVRAADFDGDGKTDIAGRDATTGMWHLSRSTGSAFANSRIGGWSTSLTWLTVVSGDFDGDGRADLAGRASTGQWFVTRRIGLSVITAAFGEWSTAVPWQNVAGLRA